MVSIDVENGPSLRAHKRPAHLRRVDWRFLLPQPQKGSFDHLVVLGGPENLAARIREVGVAERVSSTLPGEQPADALAILHDSPVSLRKAVHCLRPGGMLYYEVDRRSGAGLWASPGRIRRMLADAGLTITGIYWAKPDFAHCEMYLPLDRAWALRWYLKTLYTPITPLRTLLEPALRTISAVGSGAFAPFAPCYAVTAVAGPPVDWRPSVLGQATLPPELRERELRPLVFTDAGNRVVLLPFAGRDKQPAAVVKIPKLAEFNAKTEHEQQALARVRAQLDAPLRDTIPTPLGLLHWGDISIGLEHYAPGHSLLRSSGRWHAPVRQKIEDLRLAAEWLAEFHRQTEASRPKWSVFERERWIEQPLAAYADAFGTTTAEELLFNLARQRGRELENASLPIVCRHGDFSVWNIFRTARKLTVIDWEGGRPGLPVGDLIHFVTQWSFAVRRLQGDAAQLRGFGELFLAPERGGVSTRAAEAALHTYMARLNIDPRFLPLLLVMRCVELALGRIEQQRTMRDTGLDIRSGNRYIEYVGVLAAQAQRLFSRSLTV